MSMFDLIATILPIALLLVAWLKKVYLPDTISETLSKWADFAPQKYIKHLIVLSIRSGRRSESDLLNILSYKFLAALCVPFSAILTGAPALLPFALVTFFLPDLLLSLLVKRRQKMILKPLPDTVDLLMLCVEAGMGLDAALQKITKKQQGTGPLSEELELAGQQLYVGLNREQAYMDIYARTGLDDVKKFCVALTQSTKHGLSLGLLLRTQSEMLRSNACLRAEHRANKIPVWMTFPMCFLILPALLMLLAGPAILQNQAMISRNGISDGLNSR